MLVQDSLHRSVARTPDKVALVCDGSRLTYAEIEAAANRLANALLAHGVKRGDRVGIFLNNSVEAVVSIFGILKAGAVFVVINHTTKEDKLAYILNNCRATALVGDAQKQPLFDLLLERVQSLRFVVLAGRSTSTVAANDARLLDYAEIQARGSADRPRQVNIDVDLACLIYTSGSTGDPKGVMSDHSNVVFAATSITTYLQNVKDDVVLSVLPLSFDYGLYQLLMTFHFGGRLVLERSFAYPSAVLQRLEQERVTGFPGVPTMFAILVGMDLTSYDLSNLRYITNTAAALPPSHILTLRRKFPTATLFSMYGLTETKRTLYLPPDLLESKPGSVGIAIPGTETWIADANGNRLGPGQTGELVVRGRHVMRGYWEAPEATANRFRPGPIPGERLCYTGDLFSMDEDGCFYFVARRDDIIKSRGEKIAPKEVENVLYSLPGVVEAAVVGVPDPILGQAVKAFVVVNGTPVTENQVLAHCKANLEDFMVPKFVEFVDELPKTSSGKVKKLALV
jgi:amino acid adenylation domain-containing protein